MKISVNFPGLKSVKNYTMRITREKYEELCRVFNNTMKALQNAETEREACEIFNETILKLREIGIISPVIDIARLQKMVTGSYLRDIHQDRILKIMEKLNLTEKSDNVLCLVCGAASNTFKMDFSNRIYDMLVRMPSFLIALMLYMLLYPAILYYPPLALFGDLHPGIVGFTGIYISVPLDFPGHYGPSFFLGHALGVAIK